MAPTGSTKHVTVLVFRSMRSERGETFPLHPHMNLPSHPSKANYTLFVFQHYLLLLWLGISRSDQF